MSLWRRFFPRRPRARGPGAHEPAQFLLALAAEVSVPKHAAQILDGLERLAQEPLHGQRRRFAACYTRLVRYMVHGDPAGRFTAESFRQLAQGRWKGDSELAVVFLSREAQEAALRVRLLDAVKAQAHRLIGQAAAQLPSPTEHPTASEGLALYDAVGRLMGNDAAGTLFREALAELTAACQSLEGYPAVLTLVPAHLLGDAELGVMTLAQAREALQGRNRELAAARSRLAAVLEATSEGILVGTCEGLIQRANSSAEAIWGVASGELTGRSITTMVDDPQRVFASKDSGTAVEVSGLRGSGSFPLELHLRSMALEGQDLCVAAVRDLGPTQALQARLAIADRMASLGTMAAGVAHEINNPLSALSANLHFLRDELDGSTLGLDEALQDAQEACNQVRTIVTDLRTLSRNSPQLQAAVPLAELVDRTLRLADNEIRHRAVLVREDRAAPPAAADPVRLSQVVLNLVINAAQALPIGRREDHRITITTGPAESPDHVMIQVSDTGSGVPQAIRARVFDPFFTTKEHGEGTGLGLAICHGLVTTMGGTIRLVDGPDGGACFRVQLPVWDHQERAPSGTSGRSSDTRLSILVIDDEPLVLRGMGRLLRRHDVTLCANARDALARLNDGERYDWVLCDVMMPDLSGQDLLLRLQRDRPQTAERLIFMTGGVFTAELETFLEQSRLPVLQKPVDRRKLAAVLARVS